MNRKFIPALAATTLILLPANAIAQTQPFLPAINSQPGYKQFVGTWYSGSKWTLSVLATNSAVVNLLSSGPSTTYLDSCRIYGPNAVTLSCKYEPPLNATSSYVCIGLIKFNQAESALGVTMPQGSGFLYSCSQIATSGNGFTFNTTGPESYFVGGIPVCQLEDPSFNACEAAQANIHGGE